MKSLCAEIILLFVIASYCRTTTGATLQPSGQHQPRIVGGTEAEDGFAPYQVSIGTIYGTYVCGGAIIDKRWILTAANCVVGWSEDYLKIITGTTNRQQTATDPAAAEYSIDDIVIHPYYNKPLYHNDIAMLHTTKQIRFNGKTHSISFADYDDLVDGDRVTVTGWGSTKLWGEATVQLRKLEQNYVEHKKCKSAFSKADAKNIDPLGNMCTFSKKQEGMCHMDSGNPIIRRNGGNGKLLLVGLANWGKPCALGVPDVNCRVSYYSYWITTILDGYDKGNQQHQDQQNY